MHILPPPPWPRAAGAPPARPSFRHRLGACCITLASLLGSFAPGKADAEVPLHATLSGLNRPIPAQSTHAREFLQHLNEISGEPGAEAQSAVAPALEGRLEPDSAQLLTPSSTVYGYWPYWGDDLSTLKWDSLTHVAIFGVTLNADGSLSSTGYWTNNVSKALSYANPKGVRVHMTVICFDSNAMASVLGTSTKRTAAINAIVSLVQAYGGHGVNLDFEGLPSSQKANFVSFVTELNTRVDDLYLAMPAVDWNGSYDFDQLAFNSDGLFIMGYDYHYSGGGPGPVGPLYGGSPWSVYAIDWTIDDYLYYGAPADKIILGLPLYGFQWPTTNNAVPGTATASASSKTYEVAIPLGNQYGRLWDSVTHTPYTFPSSTSQLWYDDDQSLSHKASYAVDQNLQGIGFWALTYEGGNSGFWTMIDGVMNPGCATPDADGDGVDVCSGDCDDADSSTYPGAFELCDGRDNNCNGVADDVADADGDGYGICEDCNDTNANANPGMEELPDDGIDNNCDGQVDEGSTTGCGAALTALPNPRPLMGASAVVGLGLVGLLRRRRRA